MITLRIKQNDWVLEFDAEDFNPEQTTSQRLNSTPLAQRLETGSVTVEEIYQDEYGHTRGRALPQNAVRVGKGYITLRQAPSPAKTVYPPWFK